MRRVVEKATDLVDEQLRRMDPQLAGTLPRAFGIVQALDEAGLLRDSCVFCDDGRPVEVAAVNKEIL